MWKSACLGCCLGIHKNGKTFKAQGINASDKRYPGQKAKVLKFWLQ